MIDARPLRFVVCVVALWTGARVWMTADPAEPPRGDTTKDFIASASAPSPIIAPTLMLPSASTVVIFGRDTVIARPAPAAVRFHSGVLSPPIAVVPTRIAAPARLTPVTDRLSQADPRDVPSHRARRLSGYGWAFVRGGGAPGLAGRGQLGGSQTGFRLDYALVPRLAAMTRISTPLEADGGAEAAIGINWQPAPALPVSIIAERRVALDRGGRDAFAIMAAGGAGPVALPENFRLEAYGQAGLVGLKRRDAFIDGAATLTRPVASPGNLDITLGAGIWGAAQPGVSRLDIGPRLRTRIDLGSASLAASLDWRQRVAGDAHPRSGVALTIESGF